MATKKTNTTKKTTSASTTVKTQPATASSNLAKQIEAQMEADYMAGITYGVADKINKNSSSSQLVNTAVNTTTPASSTAKVSTASDKANEYAQKFLAGDYSFVDGINVKAAGTNPDGSMWYDDGSGALKTVGSSNVGSSSAGSSYSSSVLTAENFLNSATKNNQSTKLSDEVLATIYEYKNRPSFSYDPTQDTLYQNALNNAMRGGQMAMQDTMGQAAALTGGYGSSYATSASNQAYNNFIENAYDNMADYYNMALNAYNAEGDRLLNAYNMLSDQDKLQYQKESDAYERDYRERRDAILDERWQKSYDRSVYEYDTNLAYQKEQDALANEWREKSWEASEEQRQIENDRYDDKFEYQKEQDKLTEEWRNKEFEYQKEQDEKTYELAVNKANNTSTSKSSGGSPRNPSYTDDDDTKKSIYGTDIDPNSLYTQTQWNDLLKGYFAKYDAEGQAAADDWLYVNTLGKSLSTLEEDALSEAIATREDNKKKASQSRDDLSKRKWSFLNGILIDENGRTYGVGQIPQLVRAYQDWLAGNGESMANIKGLVMTFEDKLRKLAKV